MDQGRNDRRAKSDDPSNVALGQRNIRGDAARSPRSVQAPFKPGVLFRRKDLFCRLSHALSMAAPLKSTFALARLTGSGVSETAISLTS